MSDLDGGRLRAAADGLQSMSEALRQATDGAQRRTVRVRDENGRAEVEVDGRPRVQDLSLDADALRGDPDDLDRMLTGLLNEALTTARSATRAAVTAALPPALRRDLPPDVRRDLP